MLFALPVLSSCNQQDFSSSKVSSISDISKLRIEVFEPSQIKAAIKKYPKLDEDLHILGVWDDIMEAAQETRPLGIPISIGNSGCSGFISTELTQSTAAGVIQYSCGKTPIASTGTVGIVNQMKSSNTRSEKILKSGLVHKTTAVTKRIRLNQYCTYAEVTIALPKKKIAKLTGMVPSGVDCKSQ